MILTYLKIGAAVLLIGGAFVGGVKVTDWRWKASLLEAEQKHTELLAAEIERSNGVAAELEAERGKSKIVYKTITKKVDRIIDRPVYFQQCFDDDGLRLARAAILGQAADPGQPVGPVPSPKPLRGRNGG